MRRFIILIVILIPMLLSAQDKTCAGCGEPVAEGQYLKIGTKFFHPQHFTCNYCGQPIQGKYFEREGRFYDETCYFNHVLPPCAWCNKPLDDRVISFEGNFYHQDCYREHVALRCAACDGLIESTYFEDFWGNKYHQEHLKNGYKCDYCSRLISEKVTGGGVVYDDGRHVCNLCRKGAIDTQQQAAFLLDRVKELLWEENIRISMETIPVYLVDKPKMQELLGQRSGRETGFTRNRTTFRNGFVSKRKFDIFILHGMPEIHFISTVAHELMHVWLHLNASDKMDHRLIEGSCNYASELILKHFANPEKDIILHGMRTEEDAVYGTGYRVVRAWAGKHGRTAWLEYLKEHLSLP